MGTAIKHPVPNRVKPSFVIFDIRALWRSAPECPEVKNYKWRLNPVWHRMLYSCTYMATVGVKGLRPTDVEGSRLLWIRVWLLCTLVWIRCVPALHSALFMSVLLVTRVDPAAAAFRLWLTLSTGRELLAKIRREWAQWVAWRMMQPRLAGGVASRRESTSFKDGRVSTDHDRADGMVDKVVGHTTENRSLHLAHTSRSSNDHNCRDLVSNLTDHFSSSPRWWPQYSRHLITQSAFHYAALTLFTFPALMLNIR